MTEQEAIDKITHCLDLGRNEREIVEEVVNALIQSERDGRDDRARELRGLPSVRELNPDIAAMQDHAAENAAAIRALAGKDEA